MAFLTPFSSHKLAFFGLKNNLLLVFYHRGKELVARWGGGGVAVVGFGFLDEGVFLGRQGVGFDRANFLEVGGKVGV